MLLGLWAVVMPPANDPNQVLIRKHAVFDFARFTSAYTKLVESSEGFVCMQAAWHRWRDGYDQRGGCEPAWDTTQIRVYRRKPTAA